MIYQDIEFHNAAALEPLNGMPGMCPVRYPRAVRDCMNARGRFVAAMSPGVELRFACPSSNLRLAMAAHDNDVMLHVYCGEFGHSDFVIPAGATRVMHLSPPERFPQVTTEAILSGPFAPHLWRVQISDSTVSFLGLESFGVPVRPPLPEETPRLRWLAFGSSITHSNGKGYPHQAARRLRVDVLNKGLSGSCHIEPEVADHLATQETWDLATLELGVNMRAAFTPEAFEQRVRYLLQKLRTSRPQAPLVLITHFLNWQHRPSELQDQPVAQERQLAFDAILRDLVKTSADPHLHLLEGTEILTDFTGLCCDLLHPSDYGHVQMGENLARLLKPLLPPLAE